MARFAHTNQESYESSITNPTTKYLKWKSEEKCFSYYDKESGGDVLVPLPTKFVFLQQYHTVKGWSDSIGVGLYSNEVFYLGKEPLTIRTFDKKEDGRVVLKSKVLVEGIYNKIKPEVLAVGGKYHRSIYVMLEDGTIANLSLKGASVKAWSDFFELSRNLVDNQWVEVNEANIEKKGRVTYSTPKFSLGSTIGVEVSNQADLAASSLKTYMDEYFKVDNTPSEPVEVDEENMELNF